MSVKMDGFSFNCIAGDYRCTPGDSLTDIAKGLVHTLAKCAGLNTSESGGKSSMGIDFKIIKLSQERTHKKVEASDLSLSFVDDVGTIFNRTSMNPRGMCFLIDEIDVLDGETPLAPFLKATVEKLKIDWHHNVSFIVSGVTGSTTTLIAQHPSSERLLENVELQRMNTEELMEIIDSSLGETEVVIANDAKNAIIDLSNQFPHPVQLLGYHSFRINDDNIISAADVARAKDYVVKKLKRQEFEDRFHKLSGDTTELIRVFAKAPHETVNRNYLITQLPHLPDHRIFGALGWLHEKGFIQKQYRDTYRFTEPLFKIYLRWIFGLNK